MNVNVKLSLTDEQRNIMYRNITRKVKGMVSRKQVNEFVQGCLDAIIQIPVVVVEDQETQETQQPQQRTSQLSPTEAKEVERLRKDGKSDSYINGQLQVIRRMQKNANR